MASVAYRATGEVDDLSRVRSCPVVSEGRSGRSDTKGGRCAGDTWIQEEQGCLRLRTRPSFGGCNLSGLSRRRRR